MGPDFKEWRKAIDYELFQRELAHKDRDLARRDPEREFALTMDDAAYLGAMDAAFMDPPREARFAGFGLDAPGFCKRYR